MKFIHTSDLHIGRRLGEYGLADDQRTILSQLLSLIRTEAPDALLIAGDIYDKTVPSADAVRLLDDFLTEAAALTQILLVSGNHDSPERISFGGRLIAGAGVHLCGIYDGQVHRVTFTDAWGEVHVYLLPFLRPADVRRYFPDCDTDTYDAAFGTAIAALDVNPDARNVILAHQFVTGGERSASETVSVGTADAVRAEHFDVFDYAALGHLHRAQTLHTPQGTPVRYSGSPMAYSIAESDTEKSVTVVTLGDGGSCVVETRPLTPLRRMYRLRGRYDELMALDYYRDTDYPASYVQITLTDEVDIPDALYRLRTVYPYLLRLEYDNTRTHAEQDMTALSDADAMDPEELFAAFFHAQNGSDMDADMQEHMKALIDRLWKGEDAR
ncbi:MAG: exonuclease SbcCD subunit D [Ruminococcaceae bacterium]|nr:exonuclease SbcCD subunit D [Oscillospiraceae bacterium]